ncbi:hypothetical protein [Thioclava sp. F28-4]|uniref:hypothetical protein n=1 Tax=Thioclava sp. F28-4 TaxID=1915315 RepID=UPI0009973594|nr:hypothetical protein [Thioclava sp. F28-4]OOY03316.1 hypothetical protein BMI87_18635 [Thioclava sp. F28-4]
MSSNLDTEASNVVALKAYRRLVLEWGLTEDEAASLAGFASDRWRMFEGEGGRIELSDDQMHRLSAVLGIYHALEVYFGEPLSKTWFTLPNAGPMFGGARPSEIATRGGLSSLLAIRANLEALLQGA